MNFNLMIILFLLSFSGVASTDITSIRLKQWDSERGTPALHRQDALGRTYSYVELCTLNYGCLSSLWGEKKNVALVLEDESIFLKYDLVRIHLMDLGAFVRSGGGGGLSLYLRLSNRLIHQSILK